VLIQKQVFIDDCLIGDASTWVEVRLLLSARGISFISGARAVEGPSGFYLSAKPVERQPFGPRPAQLR
jgi:hypothetical protein